MPILLLQGWCRASAPKGRYDAGWVGGVGCQPWVSQACILVLSAGAAEAARVRASPGDPEHIGPLRPCTAAVPWACAACLRVPVLVLLEAFQEMLLAPGQCHNEEGVTFLSHSHLLSLPAPQPPTSAPPHQAPTCLYLPILHRTSR